MLCKTFARFRIPEQLVWDNGPHLVSDEFEAFLHRNGIKHIHSSPYHPASNGVAEWVVQTMQRALHTGYEQGVPLEQILAAFIHIYTWTPHATTGISPSTLWMSRNACIRLDLLKTDLCQWVRHQQDHRQAQHDMHSHQRLLKIGQRVWVHNTREGVRWVPGTTVDI